SVALVAAGVTASMRLTSATGHPAPDANSPAMANAQLSNSGASPTPSAVPGGDPTRTITAGPSGGAAGGTASSAVGSTASGAAGSTVSSTASGAVGSTASGTAPLGTLAA